MDRGKVEFAVYCEPEQEPYVGNCSAVDAKTDAAQEQLIRRQLEVGNEWAWCMVIVECTHPACPAIKGNAILGSCSYSSSKDFVENSGYYDDMRQEALDDLERQLKSACEAYDS